MAVVPRKTKDGTVYRVAILFKGKQYWEAGGSDRREADRLDARRKREVANGQFVPPQARSGGTTISSYAERFFDARTNRNAESERTQVERHALSLDWFGSLRIEDARPPHFLRLVKELRAKTREVDGARLLSEKSIANVLGTLRTMFGEAHFNEVIVGNPCVLPRKTLKRRSKARAPYSGREVLALLSDKVDITRRVFIWLAFYTGMREGEICGRRWRDWNRDSRPLGALLCSSQYDDRPLKGDEEGGDARPRVIPVHPELAKVLNEWRTTGFEIVHGRRPDDDDFIVPIRSGAGTNLTRSSAYKLWRKACDEAGVTNHSLHSTRHTFTTFARRGTPRTDAVEAITHNKRGEMVDYYNHWLWTPLCEAMEALSYGADSDERHPLAPPSGGGPGGGVKVKPQAPASPEPAAILPVTAIVDGSAEAGREFKKLPEPLPGSRNYLKSLWRRRELNPGPRGVQSAFVHVRSRITQPTGSGKFGCRA
jgi:integrase